MALEQALTEIVEDRDDGTSTNFIGDEVNKEESVIFIKGVPEEMTDEADDNSDHSSTMAELITSPKSKVIY